MWKLILRFIVLAAIGMYVLVRGGDNIDLGGEKGGIESHSPAPAGTASGAAKH